MQKGSRLRPFLLHGGVKAHEEVEQVIYTYRLPCLRLGVRSYVRWDAQNQRAGGRFRSEERSVAREVKVGSRA